MDCSDIHDCGRNTYYPALALFKIQLEKIWHHEIKDIVKKPEIFEGSRFILESNRFYSLFPLSQLNDNIPEISSVNRSAEISEQVQVYRHYQRYLYFVNRVNIIEVSFSFPKFPGCYLISNLR
jgi:hypothetical protein